MNRVHKLHDIENLFDQSERDYSEFSKIPFNVLNVCNLPFYLK